MDTRTETHDPADTIDMTQAMTSLPERYQTVLHLRYCEDLLIEEVARVMRLTRGQRTRADPPRLESASPRH